MCAIAGILGAGPDKARRLQAMLDWQRHRGPDGEGIFLDREMALGHRRLAILDLSEAGRQPMTSRDGRWTLVLNGEIFNYRELRREIEIPWRSSSDTEVLLEACGAWGVERALERTVGMFAFGLWDAWRRELTLARDRLGEKPLVYGWDGASLAFASEIQALREFHDRRLHAGAVDAYLALGYVPSPLAIFRGLQKLTAGHMLQCATGAAPRIRRWWHPAAAGSGARTGAARTGAAPEGVERRGRARAFSFFPGSPGGSRCRTADLRHARIEGLREQIGEAVRLRLRSDVRVALWLSGGVDSAVIAAEGAKQNADLEAFTVRFDRDTTDLQGACAVARRLGLRHHVVEAGGDCAAAEIGNLARRYDEPFADSSALATLALAAAMGGRSKVVLSGDGGDEAFGGYRHYEHIGAKQALKAAAAAMRLCDGYVGGRDGIYVQSKSLFRQARRARLLNGNAPANTLDALIAAASPAAPGEGALKRALRLDRELPLANGLTYKTDIALGAFGMEGRAPLLDHRVMECGAALPGRDLVTGRAKKVLLREAYRDRLPREVLAGPKHGFGAPIAEWLSGPFREIVADLLPCPLFEPGAQEISPGQHLWALVAFALWAREWKATW